MITNWNNFPKTHTKAVLSPQWLDQRDLFSSGTVIPYGNGRSYGDVCLNDHGCIISTRGLNKLMSLDKEQGLLRCESGLLLKELNNFLIPQGFTLPVVPGTEYITLGGAIANDIHGKNHHRTGSFGCQVKQFALLRSSGDVIVCSKEINSELYYATIGGLGLTGLILWAEIKLKPIDNPYLIVETLPFYSLAEFFEINQTAEQDFEYTVAWIDCLKQGKQLGRGLYQRANWASQITNKTTKPQQSNKQLTIPCYFPSWILNRFSMQAFNKIYFQRNKNKLNAELLRYKKFFFPLDGILHWNRIYGRKGFLQYQCVLPPNNAATTLNKLLTTITTSKQGSFLSVLKSFGAQSSGGLLSFPMEGITLALDFPYRGQKTINYLHRLDEIVISAGGRVYPAKDACMSSETFKTYYKNWQMFSELIDPQFSSSFWRRVMGEPS